MAKIIELKVNLEPEETYAECGNCGCCEWIIQIDPETWRILKVLCSDCGTFEVPDYDIEFIPEN